MAYVYSAKNVAKYFLALGDRDHVPIDPLKLQKLVYLAHGWSLVFSKSPLIADTIQAWRYGPVVPVLYREYKKFGASPITQPPQGNGQVIPLDERTKSLLESVWRRYSRLSALQLSMFTHEPGYAWDLARRTGTLSPWSEPEIPNELIEEEFVRRQQQAA